MIDFSMYPNFNRLLNECDTAKGIQMVKTAKTVLDTLIDIRAKLYRISFFKNDGCPITKLSASVDNDFKLAIDIPVCSLDAFVKELSDRVDERHRESFNAHAKAIRTNCPEMVDENTYLKWGTIMHCFCNEAANPSCVNRILEYLFSRYKYLDQTKDIYEFMIYDLNDYQICFSNKETLDFFATNFAECGTAGKISPPDGHYTELYSI